MITAAKALGVSNDEDSHLIMVVVSVVVSAYGDGDEALKRSIAIGRNGEMPAFGERLDETQIRLLVALLTRDSPPQENLNSAKQ